MIEVGDGIYRLGSRWVNFYLLREGDALTLVDAGLLGHADQLEPALRELGRSVSDVKAIVLTHTHSDHIGGAERFAAMTGAPVFVSKGEAGRATGADKPGSPSGVFGQLWRPSMMKFVGHFIKNKGTSHVTVPSVSPYDNGEVLEVPGRPKAVFCPGHSPGHSALLLEDRKILFCGDAMATLDVSTGKVAPMLHPFNEDRQQAIESLSIVESIDADVLLPGHGPPSQGLRMNDAVEMARGRL
jgi:glyoxylase-like metal-dependent hydrolase (beta-lactamase superfamily II)